MRNNNTIMKKRSKWEELSKYILIVPSAILMSLATVNLSQNATTDISMTPFFEYMFRILIHTY